MTNIPDTGPGLSGFLARGLWQVYQYLPFEGAWDWLALFLLLGCGAHFIFLPYLWKSVEADMTYLQGEQATEGGANQGIITSLWGAACFFFFAWFFQTAAGRTFLDGRGIAESRPLMTTDRKLFWVSLAMLFVLAAVWSSLGGKLDKQNKKARVTKPLPYTQRSLSHLYAGGGIFVRAQQGSPRVEEVFVLSVMYFEINIFFFAHLLYWYWSAASLILMHCFLLFAIFTEVFRMLFVYILHKRAFG